MKKYIGIDVSKRDFHLCFNEHGDITKFDNSQTGAGPVFMAKDIFPNTAARFYAHVSTMPLPLPCCMKIFSEISFLKNDLKGNLIASLFARSCIKWFTSFLQSGSAANRF